MCKLVLLKRCASICTLNPSFCNKSHICGTKIYNVNYLLLSITIYCLIYMFFLTLFLVTFVPKGIIESLKKNKAFQLTKVSFAPYINEIRLSPLLDFYLFCVLCSDPGRGNYAGGESIEEDLHIPPHTRPTFSLPSSHSHIHTLTLSYSSPHPAHILTAIITLSYLYGVGCELGCQLLLQNNGHPWSM